MGSFLLLTPKRCPVSKTRLTCVPYPAMRLNATRMASPAWGVERAPPRPRVTLPVLITADAAVSMARAASRWPTCASRMPAARMAASGLASSLPMMSGPVPSLLPTPRTKTEDGGLPRGQELVPGRAADDHLLALLGCKRHPRAYGWCRGTVSPSAG